MAVAAEGAAPEQIEVGATRGEGTLRYWQAKEAVAKGELLLASQISSMSRLVANATSIMRWSVTISLALIAAIGSALAPPGNPPATAPTVVSHLLWPAVVAAIFELFTAIFCLPVLLPGKWGVPGHEPGLVLEPAYGTELEVLEAMAGGYAIAITGNAPGIKRLEYWLRAAWSCFVAAPFAGSILFAFRAVLT